MTAPMTHSVTFPNQIALKTAIRYISSRLLQRYWIRNSLQISCTSHCSSVSYESQLTYDEQCRVKKLYTGLLSKQRASLAESITLVESTHPRKKIQSRFLLELVLDHLKEKTKAENWKSLRIGLSGPPGGGKSTFLEAFGKMLTQLNHRVAVLAVDPSSQGTGGSLLADKTRMPELSVDPLAYIRPSPSRGTLGGVTRNTNDAIILCEGAGYDIILVETVGVGQSELAVVDMVDLFCLLIPPAGGDELQGIKKGIVEAADLVIVNKFDGDLKAAARRVAAEYMSALKFVRPRHPEWRQKVLKVSSLKRSGFEELWETMTEYEALMRGNGLIDRRRQEQLKIWMWNYLRDEILLLFSSHPDVRQALPKIEEEVVKGHMTPGHGADRIISLFTTFDVTSKS